MTTSSQKELPGKYLQSKPRWKKIQLLLLYMRATGRLTVHPSKKALGWLTSTWSLRFLHSAGLSGALSGALFGMVHFLVHFLEGPLSGALLVAFCVFVIFVYNCLKICFQFFFWLLCAQRKRKKRPKVRHLTLRQKTSQLGFGDERPLSSSPYPASSSSWAPTR